MMYLLNAVFMLVIYSGYSRLVDRVARHKFLIGMQIATAVAILTLRFLIPAKFEWLPAVIFCTVESLFLLFMMHFWTFANGVFDPREGKRIFPLLAGAGLMGTIAGSLICKPLSAWIGTINLFFVWAERCCSASRLLFVRINLRCRQAQSTSSNQKGPRRRASSHLWDTSGLCRSCVR
jgi:ATP/ADP translocase